MNYLTDPDWNPNMRLIENAERALYECQKQESEWGVNYWNAVLNTLLRKYKQSN
jgi:hypothetical protein